MEPPYIYHFTWVCMLIENIHVDALCAGEALQSDHGILMHFACWSQLKSLWHLPAAQNHLREHLQTAEHVDWRFLTIWWLWNRGRWREYIVTMCHLRAICGRQCGTNMWCWLPVTEFLETFVIYLTWCHDVPVPAPSPAWQSTCTAFAKLRHRHSGHVTACMWHSVKVTLSAIQTPVNIL